MRQQNPIPARASRNSEQGTRQQGSGSHAAVSLPSRTMAARGSRRQLTDEIEDDDSLYSQRPKTSVRRYRTTSDQLTTRGPTHLIVYRRRTRKPQQAAAEQRPDLSTREQPARFHWLCFLGGGMLSMVMLWTIGLAGIHWWQTAQNDLHYGRPRTYQCDVRVGHHDSVTPSHFIAVNLDRHVEIFELPGDDATKAKVYIGPVLTGDGQDLSSVMLHFEDVNGDGKPDMIVEVDGTDYPYINDGSQFRPATPQDHVQLNK